MRDRTVWKVLLLVAVPVLVAAPAVAQPRGRSTARPRSGAQLQVGQPAPDMTLSPLTFAENDKGEMVGKIGTEKVKLSDFKGKAPICIFSSSYT